MSRFISPLITESLSPEQLRELKSDVQLYRLFGDFCFESTYLGAIITVPNGFVTDLASIPRPVYSIVAPSDPIMELPSVGHDYLYARQGEINGMRYDRKDADHVLDELMELAGAGRLIRKLVFAAVRLGGGSHWNPKPYKE